MISHTEYEELRSQNEWGALGQKQFSSSNEQLDGQLNLLFSKAEAYASQLRFG